MNRPRLVSGVLFALSTVAGCGVVQESDRGAVVGLLIGGEEYQRLVEAHERRVVELTTNCMRAEGFNYQPVGSQDQELSISPLEGDRYYGIVDTLDRVQFTNDSGAGEANPGVDGGDHDLDPAYLEAYQTALAGSDGRIGCGPEARSQADDEFEMNRLHSAGEDLAALREELLVDELYEKAVYDWERCMDSQGIDSISRPEFIYNAVFEEWVETGSVTALELEAGIFAADEECPDPSSGYSLDEATELLLDRNPDLVDSLSDLANH